MKFYEVLEADECRQIVETLNENEWQKGIANSKIPTGKVKQNLELQYFDNDVIKDLVTDVHQKVLDHPEIADDHLVRQVIVPKFNKYVNGGNYGPHADAGLMMGRIRTDVAMTLFLNDDYEGGELICGGLKFKGNPGTAVVYDCWRTHEVTPVTKGERICAITWMQSWIADPEQRELIRMFRSSLADIDRSSDEQRLYPNLSSIYGKLIRMWAA